MDKFQNKYRIPSARLQNWDYSSNAAYFVTICAYNRECYFGHVAEEKMVLSEIGKFVDSEWLKTFDIRKDMNLTMGEYVVMPNHFHAIIIIGKNEYNRGDAVRGGGGGGDAMHRRDAMHRVSTNDKPANKFGPQSKNLASIIRGFKSAVTVHARKIHADFAWQSRFHDHIIRDDESFERILNYIRTNPSNWKEDRFTPDHSAVG